MPHNRRIPQSKPLFFSYMASTNAYLLAGTGPPNWQRLNWLVAEQAQWQTYATQAAVFITQWATPANRTANLIIQIDSLITQVHIYDQQNHLLDRIAAQSPSTAQVPDFTTFNILHNLPPTSGTGTGNNSTLRTVATENTVYFSVTNGGAGQLICHCKPNESSNRSHLLTGYFVEAFYEILAQNAPAPTTAQLSNHELFTKSHFALNLGGSNSGQKLYIALRWRHKSNPALNGSLAAIQSITIG